MLAVTHDIKAPLGAIMGYTELLERLTRGERERHYLENITRSSEHLLALTRSLLDFYRLDIHKMELNTVPFIPERSSRPSARALPRRPPPRGLR